MQRKIILHRDKLLLLTLSTGLLALSLLLYLFSIGVFTSLSSLFRLHPPYLAMFNEYTPLAVILLVLVWVKMARLTAESNNVVSFRLAALTIVFFVLVALLFYRFWDVTAMLAYPYNVNDMFINNNAEIWMRIFFFSSLSLILLGFFAVPYGLKGLKTMFVAIIIPAFYTFNTDVVVHANNVASFSIFYPIYNFILEVGKFETLAISNLLSLFNIRNVVSVRNFPYRIMMGGTNYLINMPCIGWEGITGYTIIFLAFMFELDISNRMKILWAVLGFLGTIGVNLVRLTLILFAGAFWGAPAADIIHTNAGDVIFLFWILAFLYFVIWFSKRPKGIHKQESDKDLDQSNPQIE